ncbi:multidrug resistance protein ABC superfamily [Phytophthora cinnamomi]|uniref:multidrug resistance protein ABC superfamily n=1 Tax=Phytophthora cinnamomi TaxID=4785 RepID=UPI00355A0C86|nr:multidrug resistance protein ABC superfamily [Phytophthora cinnamomi]
MDDTDSSYAEAPATPRTKSSEGSTPFSQLPNPLARASLPSIILAQWIQPMVSLGARHVLEKEDVWPICTRDACASLEQRFRQVYDPSRRHLFNVSPLAAAYARTFQAELAFVLVSCVLYVFALALQSYVAQAILQFLNDEENLFHISSGYWLMAMMTLSSLVAVCALNYVFFSASRIGANMRSLTMSLVFDKALKLSSAARQDYTTGEVLTLMSVDTERVFLLMIQGPWLFMGPLSFIISVVLIGMLFDFYSALGAAVVLVVVMTISAGQGRRIADFQKKLLNVIDERVKVTSEALQGIRVMKYYAWEESLAQRVEKLRGKEVGLLRKFHMYQVVNTVMLFLTPSFVSGVTLGIYVLIHHTISVVEAFTLVAMVNICRTALNQLPQAIAGISKARISYARLDAFLTSDEVAIQSLLFAEQGAATPTNKSPLLTDANEAQDTWIRNATLRDNILFEEPYNAERYAQVLDASQLAMDLKSLPNGDSTEIGERGINLSGGQKARVAIARAMYRSGTDVLILDDPLSAVDPHVARSIFDKCIVGLASGQTRLLVVNSHYDLLARADQVVVMGDGAIVGHAARTTVDWWPGHWARNMHRRGVDPTYSGTTFGMWYLGLIVLCSILTLIRGVTMIETCMRSSQHMHDELFRRVLRAPVTRYFDVTPIGQILNRFSNDLDQMDTTLPLEYQLFFQNLSMALGSLVVSAFASYWIGVSYIPLMVIFVMTGQYFKKTSRELKRLEGITRTPVYNLFSETLSGLPTIRAFRMEEQFSARNRQVVDTNANMYLTYWSASRWLATRLDLMSVVIIFVVTLYLVSTRGEIGSMTSGLSLTYALMLTSVIQWVMRSVDRVDNATTSVERLLFFREIEREDDGGTKVTELAASHPNLSSDKTHLWPSQGAVRFEGLCLRYRPELPLVLKGVDMDVGAGEKIGICGRTGAGKSSLMVALFRICDFYSGRVLIDDVDISSVNLRELRRSLAIIPQDPVLFSGPLRENLDPFHEYSDERIWRVLQQVHMADNLRRWGTGLDFEVAEGGDNLSVGQRQLICIGRALLKDSKVVVLDEATANVDTATDALIQTTIQDTFQDKTVLIIAHRINTIMHCDKIAVMDAGRVAEFGSPSELLARPQSVFTGLTTKSSKQ